MKVVYGFLSIVASCMLLYGVYWLIKSGSYFLFYESMVQDTVRELVKLECLK